MDKAETSRTTFAERLRLLQEIAREKQRREDERKNRRLAEKLERLRAGREAHAGA